MKQVIAFGLIALTAACSPPVDTRADDVRATVTAQPGANGTIPTDSAPTNDTNTTFSITATNTQHAFRTAAARQGATSPPLATPRPTPTAQATATGAAPARSAMRDCYLSVDGRVQVAGRCRVFPMGPDQYTLNTWDGGKPQRSHFAIVTKDRNADPTATATWNADVDDDRALDPLGTVSRDGDCWVNERARICVR